MSDLALLGRGPAFPRPLPVGQINLPDWHRFERLVSTIGGPGPSLADRAREAMCRLLNVEHVILLANATIGLSLAARALELSGRVIVPAFTFAATVQALSWAGAEPFFCDVDPDSHCASPATVAAALERAGGARGILPVHLWGNGCDCAGLESLGSRHGAKVFYDAAHAVGCRANGRPIGGFGECEIFSFHATKILSATEGGCVATNDAALAREIGALMDLRAGGAPVPVANAAFSEYQAAFLLLSLEDFPENIARNRARFARYHANLAGAPGVRLMRPGPGNETRQYMVMEVERAGFGLSRDELVEALERENVQARKYFVPGMHKSPPYAERPGQPELPNTDFLCRRVMQLPSGAQVGDAEIDRICELVLAMNARAGEVSAALARKG